MVLNGRLKVNIERNGMYCENQNGFRALRRGEDNMYVISEMIERVKKEGKRVYMAFLDIEKAYDRVDGSILWKVLERCCICEKVLNIIMSMYVNTKGKYALGEIKTDWVKSVNGVRQGCILSPLLFGLYTEELAVRVNKCNKGIRVGDSRLNVLLYADDIVVMSESSDDLQDVLNVVAGYGKDFNVNFSDDKSEVLIVNGEADEGENGWKLGEKNLKRTKEYKYLGMWLNEDGSAKEMREKMFKARQWSGRLASVARMRGNKYEVLRNVWKTIAVPSLMRGLDVMPCTFGDCDRMDVIQNVVGRVALGANRYVGTEAIRGDMGWSMFRERVMKGKLNYKIRLERMPDERIAKNIYEWNASKSRWSRVKHLVNVQFLPIILFQRSL